ncbi:MAG: thiamine pyrophosphate-binding protein [Candidatus Heimdallarchaeota archaeon]|nr:thiamine pyrophosphate-binding protein [Candidatus Heimdallarchaeota archaeon]
MHAAKILLQMLSTHDVQHIFGLPGETTLDWYVGWQDWETTHSIEHVLTRDERSAAYMADAYARLTFKPGVVEAPSVGAPHLIPGVIEAYKASVPLLIFTSDVPLHTELRNMLTAFDQTALFKSITKATITVTKASEIPHVIRRAFRLATGGKPGPIHIRVPMDVLSEDVADPEIHSELYAQKEFTRYPSARPTPEMEKIRDALTLLNSAERPVLICGQGILFSQAWEEVREFAELMSIPIGTTISGKGSIAEIHPLSIGVIGSRGGTRFSNKIVREADVIFYIGTNTDSANTSKWTLPAKGSETKIIHCDISETEPGNNYQTDVILIGDAKSTLKTMIDVISTKIAQKKYHDLPRVKQIIRDAKEYNEYVWELKQSEEKPIHPLRFIHEFSKTIPDNYVITTDPGVSAIYPSAFHKLKRAGRSMIFNYAMGSLGYAIPASVGAHFARPDSCIVALTGDGSFGFTAGELETISRIGGNINIILFNNGCFGWIKGELQTSYGSNYVDFATNFQKVDYQKIAEGFGLTAHTIQDPKNLSQVLQQAFRRNTPTFIDLHVRPENELIPPVPAWVKIAKKTDLKYIY